MKRQRVIIMGAAGRDFHNFNMVYRGDPDFEVVAFTAAQIPMIGGRLYPPGLSGPLYPQGIPIRPEEELPELIGKFRVDQVAFSYSDVSHEYVMHKASLCMALGCDFTLLGPKKTMIESSRPVLSVCAVRTGAGKSGITKYIAGVLMGMGMRPVAIRHPMPYSDLIKNRVQRYGSMSDVRACGCTIEEREEYEPLAGAGVVVYAGVDYEAIVEAAEKEADVLLWDGGNNDLPFLRPDLEVVVLDPLRPGHEITFHPGEANLRRAHIAVINKVNTAGRDAVAKVEDNIRAINGSARIIHTASRVRADNPGAIRGRRVLVVEDGPTLTHGGMAYGAGVIAARDYGAAELVDPRPFAIGSIRETFEEYPHIGNLVPAMGYSDRQMRELKETIESTPCDLVLIATPVDLKALLELSKETVRVTYDIEEMEGAPLKKEIENWLLQGARSKIQAPNPK
ncbi:MAG TPA: cyclic 2,3-diphosphoglycerate synthase [Nitrospirota bacterium]|nr:cyclic 2,3-diphosphoglycerate synthase [Nitrospirota bacterium]